MLTKLRHSLPLQLMLAALLAWLFAQLIASTSGITQTGWYQFLMLGKTTYIGLLKMVVGLVVLFSLLQGITSIGSITRLKQIGRNTVLFYSFTTLIAISLPKFSFCVELRRLYQNEACNITKRLIMVKLEGFHFVVDDSSDKIWTKMEIMNNQNSFLSKY